MKNWIEYTGLKGRKWKYKMPDGRWFRTSVKPTGGKNDPEKLPDLSTRPDPPSRKKKSKGKKK